LIALTPRLAVAHALLDHAVPAVGATIAGAPQELRLVFSEAVEPLFCSVVVSTGSGSPVASAPAQADPADQRQLVLPLPHLPPGTYAVHWRAVSVDTHRTEGHFSFTVRP
jgi:hypothetical protein